MDMHWLDDVLVLLEERNMTRAAARRNITQPAFSRRIRGFEDWLGVTVLDRGTNRIDISPALLANEGEIRALVARLRDLRGKIAYFDPAGSTVAIAAQHTAVLSAFPEMALRAKLYAPGVRFRLRAANLRDCAAMFLRGDTSMLVCYESEQADPLPFGDTIRRELWSVDDLVPVVGGPLRSSVSDTGQIPDTTPAIVYPIDSYFGDVLNAAQRPFGTTEFSENPVIETAFSSGIKELVMKGIGVGWLPLSMIHREIEGGELVSLANWFGREKMAVAIYADVKDQSAQGLLEFWSMKQR